MTAKTDLTDVPDDRLLEELRNRGLVLSVWNAEDVLSALEEDDDVQGLSDEQKQAAASEALFRLSGSLSDVLGARGNEHISDGWHLVKEEVLAEVLTEAAPGS